MTLNYDHYIKPIQGVRPMVEPSEDVEVLTDLEGNALPQKTEPFYDLVQKIENADELLADPNFDVDKLVDDLKNKVDGIDKIILWAKGRRDDYKKVGQSYTKQGVAMENTIERIRTRMAEVMVAEGVMSYPGKNRRVDVKYSKPTLVITAEASAIMHLKYPDLCKVTKTYSWDKKAVEAALRAEELDDDIAIIKEGNPFVKFFNNAKKSMEKGVKKVTKKASNALRKVNAQDNPEMFIPASEAHTLPRSSK
jgi:uncharacterized protein YoxC